MLTAHSAYSPHSQKTETAQSSLCGKPVGINHHYCSGELFPFGEVPLFDVYGFFVRKKRFLDDKKDNKNDNLSHKNAVLCLSREKP